MSLQPELWCSWLLHCLSHGPSPVWLPRAFHPNSAVYENMVATSPGASINLALRGRTDSEEAHTWIFIPLQPWMIYLKRKIIYLFPQIWKYEMLFFFFSASTERRASQGFMCPGKGKFFILLCFDIGSSVKLHRVNCNFQSPASASQRAEIADVCKHIWLKMGDITH